MNQSQGAVVPESVWSYPRPPRVEPLRRRAHVEFDGVVIADSRRAVRVLETSHPPAVYIPPEDVLLDWLQSSSGSSVCEWKGEASYWDVVAARRRSPKAAWSYRDPRPAYRELKGYLAFYPGRVDACYLDEERVRPQDGDFYGGWITADITGPFKGGPDTAGW